VTPLYPQKLALTSPTGGGRSVGIVRVRTKATEFSFSGRGNQLYTPFGTTTFGPTLAPTMFKDKRGIPPTAVRFIYRLFKQNTTALARTIFVTQFILFLTHRKHSVSFTKTSLLMLSRDIDVLRLTQEI